MKNSIILLAVLLGAAAATAQDSDYLPIAREGVKWVYYVMPNSIGVGGYPYSGSRLESVTYYFEGDSVSKSYIPNDPYGKYKKLWRVYGWEQKQIGVSTEPEVIAYVAEDSKRVFVKRTDKFDVEPVKWAWNLSYMNINGYYRGGTNYPDRDCLENEVVVFDFNDYAGHLYKAPRIYDTTNGKVKGYWGVYAEDEVTINGRRLKRYEIGKGPSISIGTSFDDTKIQPWSNDDGKAYVIEGYGAVFNADLRLDRSFFLFPAECSFWGMCIYFSHIEENGEIVYKGEKYDWIQQQLKLYGNGGDTGVGDVPVSGTEDVGDAPYYDMHGHAVAAPTQPGIYIHNGQKVVVK